MVKVRLLAAMGEYAEGDELSLESDVAEKLVSAGLAEVSDGGETDDAPKGEDEPDGDEMKAVVNKITSKMQKVIEKAVKKPAEDKTVKLPAKPIDRNAGFKKMGDWLRAMYWERQGDHNASRKMYEWRKSQVMQKAPTGQSESADSEHSGGDTVPEIWANELWEKMRNEFLITDHTKKYEASGDTIRIPIINDTSRKTGSRPLRYYAIGEGNAYTSSKIVTGQVVLTPFKYGVLAYSTLELLRDSNSNFEQIITDQIAKELRFALNDLTINGSGSSAPNGLLNQNALVTISKESGQVAKSVWLPNLAKMIARLGYGLSDGAMFLVNRAVWAQINMLAFDPQATAKVSAWGLTYNFADPYPLRFAGIPIQEMEQCAALGAAGDIILVNLSQIATFMKPIEISMSEHVAFLTDEIVYKGCVRYDADSLWSAAETPFNGTDTVSPVVVREAVGST